MSDKSNPMVARFAITIDECLIPAAHYNDPDYGNSLDGSEGDLVVTDADAAKLERVVEAAQVLALHVPCARNSGSGLVVPCHECLPCMASEAFDAALDALSAAKASAETPNRG